MCGDTHQLCWRKDVSEGRGLHSEVVHLFFHSRGEFVRFCGPTAQLYRGRAPASTGQKEPFQGKSCRQHGRGEHSGRRTVILVPPEQLLWSLSHTVAWGVGGLPRIGLRALTPESRKTDPWSSEDGGSGVKLGLALGVQVCERDSGGPLRAGGGVSSQPSEQAGLALRSGHAPGPLSRVSRPRRH